MKYMLLFICLTLTGLAGCAQNGSGGNRKDKAVGGSCEGCEAVFESPVPFDRLKPVDTLPDFKQPGPLMEISGFIYQKDGKTPAPGVVLYIYHTDQQGIYPTRGNETGWGRRHGYIRGWVRSDQNGFYKFYTLRPASYPNSTNPQHIHPVIKEPGYTAYWIDEFVFEDDPLFQSPAKNPRGGSGVLKVSYENGMQKARRDIILGLNVPGYE
jgi:protocatechuate 3,4-dioxygenase beta subunit